MAFRAYLAATLRHTYCALVTFTLSLLTVSFTFTNNMLHVCHIVIHVVTVCNIVGMASLSIVMRCNAMHKNALLRGRS